MSGKPVTDIRDLTSEGIKSFILANAEKPFRGRQVFEWLWKRTVTPLMT